MAAAQEIKEIERYERASTQNERIATLTQELARRGFTSVPLVLVKHRTWVDVGTIMDSYRTFVTQFLCHITWQGESTDTTKPRWGTPDMCFGLSYDKHGNNVTLWIGFTDNRQFPEEFDAQKRRHSPYAELLSQVLEMYVEKTKGSNT